MEPFVITNRCADACDTACVDVCPVDCIHGPIENALLQDMPQADRVKAGFRLHIDPDECIGCAACQPECPEAAIFEASALPDGEAEQLEVARAFFRERAAR